MKNLEASEKKKWLAPEQCLGLLPAHLRNPSPSVYLSDNYTVVDFETTTKEFGSPHNEDNTTLLASWTNGVAHPRPGCWRQVGSVFDMQALVSDIQAADFFVAHHSKFEYGWLERCGLDIGETLAFCTKLAEKCIAGNRQWGLSLDDCLKRRGWAGKDPIGRLIRLGVDTLTIPLPWLGKYCDMDVAQTQRLFLDQREQMETDGLLAVAFTRNILTPVLYDIEKRGLNLDPARCDAVLAHYKNKEAKLAVDFAECSDGANPKSYPQKVTLLYETLGIAHPKDDSGKPMVTDSGSPATDAPALKALKLRNKKQKHVVATLQSLTSVRDALSKYVVKLYDCAHNIGILYGEFIQTVAQTHRLSSKGRIYAIQLQNFQRLFRPVVCPRNPGWSIGDGDSANIEFRTAVDLAKDEQGLADIEGGIDIHANTAQVILAADWDPTLSAKEGTNADLRTASKANTFKPLYGGQSGTDKEREYFAYFRDRYSATNKMQVGWTETVLRTKELRVASGLIFYWPNCKLRRDGKYIKYTTQIFDYPVQSLATAEMLPTSTVYLWHCMRAAGMESFLVDIVHDSAVGEIHPEEKEQWAEYLKYAFNVLIVWYLKEVYHYEWTTPLASDVVFNDYWGETEGWLDQWNLKD